MDKEILNVNNHLNAMNQFLVKMLFLFNNKPVI